MIKEGPTEFGGTTIHRTSLAEPIIEVLSGKAPDGAAGIERRGGNRRGRHVAIKKMLIRYGFILDSR
jgi:hypothetical protein